jgi:putative ABC transport system substrate-binding protein
MRRRDFITLVGGAAAAWPLPALAQQATKPPTIGFLGADATAWGPWKAAFVARLRDLGWIEGRTIAIEYRWAEGRPERYAEIAAEFIRLKVDAIVTNQTGALPLKQATAVTPIVFVLGIDPLRDGLVQSLARPGANITGLSTQSSETAGKRIQILQEIVPNLHRLAVLFNPDFSGDAGEVLAAARTLGLDVTPLQIRRAEDIGPSFVAFKAQADALYVVQDSLVNANRTRIMTFALTGRLPTMFGTREYVETGGLVSYGPSFPDQFTRAAEYVDKILRGTKPGDIPVEQPTRFYLTINLTTATALGLTISESFLARADEVIE